jgi:hypothetical protein
MDAQSFSGDPADAHVSLDWHVLEFRCDMLLLQYRGGRCVKDIRPHAADR